MLSYQLGRRNLSELDRFEIVQKFKNYFTSKAKQNNSNGGKGLTNLTKVNTREEMAKMVGVSSGTYSKLDKVMKSNNEEIKQKLRRKEISTDKAFKIINNVSNKAETEIRTPKVKIEEMDARISAIEKEEQRFQQEKQDILKRRKFIFESLEIKCPVKYRWENERSVYNGFNVIFYIDYEGKENIIYEGFITNEKPDDVYVRSILDKYKADFLMMWGKAYQEHINAEVKEKDDWNKACEGFAKGLNDSLKNSFDIPMINEIITTGFRTLAKKYHPDNNNGDKLCEEKMKQLNEAKEQLMKLC